MIVERDEKGKIIPGQKSLNTKGRPKKLKLDPIHIEEINNLSAYEVIDRAMRKALLQGEEEKAAQYALKLLPYQTARLSSIDSIPDHLQELIITLPDLPTLDKDDDLWAKIRESDIDTSRTQLPSAQGSDSDSLAEDEI